MKLKKVNNGIPVSFRWRISTFKLHIVFRSSKLVSRITSWEEYFNFEQNPRELETYHWYNEQACYYDKLSIFRWYPIETTIIPVNNEWLHTFK